MACLLGRRAGFPFVLILCVFAPFYPGKAESINLVAAIFCCLFVLFVSAHGQLKCIPDDVNADDFAVVPSAAEKGYKIILNSTNLPIISAEVAADTVKNIPARKAATYTVVEGDNIIKYYSIDKNHNYEVVKSTTFKVNTQPPVVRIGLDSIAKPQTTGPLAGQIVSDVIAIVKTDVAAACDVTIVPSGTTESTTAIVSRTFLKEQEKLFPLQTDGTYDVRARCVDQYGNIGVGQQALTLGNDAHQR